MSILTSAGMDKILRRIMESGDINEEITNDIQRLRDDFNERTSYLERLGTVYTGDDVDEYKFTINENSDVYTPAERTDNDNSWEMRYNDLKKQYLDRFFGGVEREGVDIQEIMDDTIADVQRDGEPQSFDELLERTEG